MWAPADLFGSVLNPAVPTVRRTVTFFFERPLVFTAVALAGAAAIALVAVLGRRRGGRE